MLELKKSQIEAVGELVSFKSEKGGIAVGYRLPKECWKNSDAANVVFRSGGNGFYYPEIAATVWADAGETYKSAVCGQFPA